MPAQGTSITHTRQHCKANAMLKLSRSGEGRRNPMQRRKAFQRRAVESYGMRTIRCAAKRRPTMLRLYTGASILLQAAAASL